MNLITFDTIRATLPWPAITAFAVEIIIVIFIVKVPYKQSNKLNPVVILILFLLCLVEILFVIAR